MRPVTVLLTVAGQQTSTPDESPTPRVEEYHVAIPALLLLLMLFGFISLPLAAIILVLATVYVHFDSKKFKIKGNRALLVLLIAIWGLPIYASELYDLRKKQLSSLASV